MWDGAGCEIDVSTWSVGRKEAFGGNDGVGGGSESACLGLRMGWGGEGRKLVIWVRNRQGGVH